MSQSAISTHILNFGPESHSAKLKIGLQSSYNVLERQ
jgi:hypothetical protein